MRTFRGENRRIRGKKRTHLLSVNDHVILSAFDLNGTYLRNCLSNCTRRNILQILFRKTYGKVKCLLCFPILLDHRLHVRTAHRGGIGQTKSLGIQKHRADLMGEHTRLRSVGHRRICRIGVFLHGQGKRLELSGIGFKQIFVMNRLISVRSLKKDRFIVIFNDLRSFYGAIDQRLHFVFAKQFCRCASHMTIHHTTEAYTSTHS